MLATLFVVAQVLAHPAPQPTQLVLDGCGTASAIRAAEIRLMPPAHPHTRTLLGEILRQRDGATCLLESEVLVDLFAAGRSGDLVARALAQGLEAAPHVAARASFILDRITQLDPAGSAVLQRRIDARRKNAGFVHEDERLRAVTGTWLAGMPRAGEQVAAGR